MPDRYSEWDAYRLKRRSEPIPPETADTPPAEAYSPAVVWASSLYAEDVQPGDVDAQPLPAAPHTLPDQEGSAGAFPPSPRSKVRPILLGVASVSVLVALIGAPVVAHLTGGSGHKPPEAGRQPPPIRTSTTPSLSPASPSTTPSLSPGASSTTPPLSPGAPSITGPGCGGGTYQRAGYYVDGKAGWLSGTGGYSGAGCDGRFDALPMSGDAKKADPSLYATWAFDPGARRQCKVALYIPDNDNKMYVGGSPAHYTVLQKKGNKKLLSFSIDQPRSKGRWVNSAAFKADGPFDIRLANTGKDWTDTKKTFTHVVAAQARAICS
jgi:hypothetical protein